MRCESMGGRALGAGDAVKQVARARGWASARCGARAGSDSGAERGRALRTRARRSGGGRGAGRRGDE